MSSGMKLGLRPVVAVGRPHRPDDGQLVDICSNPREVVADLDSTFAVLPETILEWEEHIGPSTDGKSYPLVFKFLWTQHVGVWSFRDRLTGILREHRLGI